MYRELFPIARANVITFILDTGFPHILTQTDIILKVTQLLVLMINLK